MRIRSIATMAVLAMFVMWGWVPDAVMAMECVLTRLEPADEEAIILNPNNTEFTFRVRYTEDGIPAAGHHICFLMETYGSAPPHWLKFGDETDAEFWVDTDPNGEAEVTVVRNSGLCRGWVKAQKTSRPSNIVYSPGIATQPNATFVVAQQWNDAAFTTHGANGEWVDPEEAIAFSGVNDGWQWEFDDCQLSAEASGGWNCVNGYRIYANQLQIQKGHKSGQPWYPAIVIRNPSAELCYLAICADHDDNMMTITGTYVREVAGGAGPDQIVVGAP